MITSLRSQLTAHGVPRERIHAEEFGFAKVGASESVESRAAPGRSAPRRPRRWPALVAFAALVTVVGIVIGNQISSGESVRAERAAPASSVAAGKSVFASAGCGDCHAFAAAGSSGDAGPDLDEAEPDAARVRSVVTDGRGAMPSFEDELSGRQIRDVAAFVSESGGR